MNYGGCLGHWLLWVEDWTERGTDRKAVQQLLGGRRRLRQGGRQDREMRIERKEGIKEEWSKWMECRDLNDEVFQPTLLVWLEGQRAGARWRGLLRAELGCPLEGGR